MRTEMRMPQMGESIAEATILKWLKNVGDLVKKDETILEISTDKVDSEIPSPATGKIVEIHAKEGQTVAVKSVIAVIDSDESAKSVETKQTEPLKEVEKPVNKQPLKEKSKVDVPPAIQAETSISSTPSHIGDKFLSPLVRNLAAQYSISPNELNNIHGSGAHGRLTKDDILNYVKHRSQPTTSKSSSAQVLIKQSPQAVRPQYDESGIKREPMDNMRKLIAEHMVRSKATSPHVYSMAEVDVTNIAKWRTKNQNAFVEREGFKLSFTPFFLEATIKALIQFPKINASVDGDTIVLKRDINLGCAVALGKDGLEGLIVPVIKNADHLNFSGIASALNDIAQRARNKKLTPSDVQGGTFTVTNPGIFGNIMGCPIISQPQLGILAIGAIKKRPVVVDDAIAIRDIVILTLSYDHRVIDGAISGHFLSFIQNYLENWDMNRII